MKLVRVEWLDSHIMPTWTRDAPETAALKCRTVGWLVHDGKDAKTLAASVTDEDAPQLCCQITIPTAAIVRTKVLK
ncbi:MAG: hypothetical protein ACREBW_04370 [Candidatus Micrarchaeaceae archaeon]